MVEMIKTYIKGFDEQLNGGIPKGHIVLLCGTPGTMKTSLTFNILYNNAKKKNLKGLYISLEESRESLRDSMIGLGMTDIDELELYIVDIGKIRLRHKEEEARKEWVNLLSSYINQRVVEDNFDLVVIDSVASLYSLTELENPRRVLFHFMGGLRNLGVTTFLVSEVSHGSNQLVRYDEDFMVDGIFYLKLREVGETDVQLRIRCIKMRQVNHYRGWLRLIHRDNEFITTPVITE